MCLAKPPLKPKTNIKIKFRSNQIIKSIVLKTLVENHTFAELSWNFELSETNYNLGKWVHWIQMFWYALNFIDKVRIGLIKMEIVQGVKHQETDQIYSISFPFRGSTTVAVCFIFQSTVNTVIIKNCDIHFWIIN